MNWLISILVGLGIMGYQVPVFNNYVHLGKGQECISINGLPDYSCTPGVVNVAITQANIKQTICNPKWSTKTIRPPISLTNKLKQQGMIDYNVPLNASLYEEDHLISLELGGAPADPKNLWPEAYAGEFGARVKDKVENWLHRAVCSGELTLEEAQRGVAQNWKQYIPQVQNTYLGASMSDD